jgi:hypothetical protein
VIYENYDDQTAGNFTCFFKKRSSKRRVHVKFFGYSNLVGLGEEEGNGGVRPGGVKGQREPRFFEK